METIEIDFFLLKLLLLTAYICLHKGNEKIWQIFTHK